MEIKKIAKNSFNFAINRIIQIMGISISISGLLLLISLLSYSPEDPNFIFPDNTKIKNILGFQGSFISDIFFQSFGLISLLIPFSFIFTGSNIFFKKKLLLIIESLFFTIIYSLFGSLFFSYFYPNAFKLYINGNGGFIGKFLDSTFLNSLINFNTQISYYTLIVTIIIFYER
jgi:S-DNA-T family DNA segregation ATPase FtsK/SpoIIIE